jgi:hypothetical protein
MTNELTASKAEFALDLQTAGLDVLDYVPERVVPPIIIVSPDGTYITPDSVGKSYLMGLKLTLVASTATNEQSTEELDDLISRVLTALQDLHYVHLTSVQQPYRLQANTAEYLATDITLDLSITL